MAEFLGSLSAAMQVTAIAIGPKPIVSDPQFSHWVVVDDKIAGEARAVTPAENGTNFAYVRLFNMPENAEYGYIETAYLRSKDA